MKYDEDTLVQETTAAYLRDQLGWENVYAYNTETFGKEGTFGRKDETEIIVKDAQNKQHRLAMTDVEGTHPQQKSLMPELLLREMTAQQVADLLAYLASLK